MTVRSFWFRWLLSALVAAGALALALGVAEWGMRWIRPELLPSNQLRMQADEFVGWRFIPNQRVKGRTEWGHPLRQRTNALGFADVDHALTAEASARRVAFLGDSFTAAVGVDFHDSFVQVAGRELERRAPGRFWEVMNFGLPSMGTVRERLVWKHYASAFQPDMVVLAFFLGNDVANNMPGYEEAMAVRLETKHRSWFYRAFLEPSLLYQQFKLAQRDFRRGWHLGKGRAITAEDARKPFWKRSYAPLDWQGYLVKPNGAAMEAWNSTETALIGLRDEVRATGARFLVVLVPGMEAVMPEEFRRSLQRYPGIESFEIDPDYPRQRLARFLSRHRIPIVDLQAEFKAEAKGESAETYYFHFDQHFSPQGHLAAGRAIARGISAEPSRR